MVEHCIHIGWKYTLIVIVHFYGRVCPPQEGLWQGGTIAHLSLYFQECTSRTKCKTGHSLLMKHPLHFVYPNGYTSILVLFYLTINGQIGRRTVVLRPIELNTSRNPRAGQAYQSRFNHMIVVDKMTLLYLIVSHLDTSTQFRQNHHFDIFVLQIYGTILLITFFIGYRFNNRVWIDYPTATLIYSFLQKDRILFGGAYLIGRNHHRFLPSLYHTIISLPVYFPILPTIFLWSRAIPDRNTQILMHK